MGYKREGERGEVKGRPRGRKREKDKENNLAHGWTLGTDEAWSAQNLPHDPPPLPASCPHLGFTALASL